MKANKAFYASLREDVNNRNIRHALCLFTWSHKDKNKEIEIEKAREKDNEKSFILEKLAELQALKEKAEGLQSQVELLEKRNEELTEKNKELEARATPIHPSLDIDPNSFVFSDEDLDDLMGVMEVLSGNNKKAGFISLKDIARWGNEGTANVSEARLIKEMIRDLMPVMSDEERELVKNIGSEYKKNDKFTVAGDFVMHKNVENEVSNVESGGTGISINK